MSASSLPPLFAGWAAEFLDGPVPGERHATCSRCAMCAPADAPPSPGLMYYSPTTVCCTFYPDLANFLVGRMLGEHSPEAAEGRATVEARIERGVSVTPLGLGRLPVYTLIYERGLAAFGRAEKLNCPHHLPDGRCGVWRNREATCATWFCKHERGAVSKTFWRRMHDLLGTVELALRRSCVLQLDPGPAALAALFPAPGEGAAPLRREQIDERVDPDEQARLWGRWLGREREFYAKCSAIVDALRWPEVLAIGGVEVALRLQLLREAHAAVLSPAVPERVQQRGLRVLYASAELARVATYSEIDPLDIPRRLLDVLHYFDGRTTEQALAAIHDERGLRIAPGVVRKLVDFGLLAANSEPR